MFIFLLGMAAGAFAQAAPLATAQPSGQTPPKVLDGSAKVVEHYHPNQMLRLAFALKPPHLDQEREFIVQLHDKKSPEFHHFLTADEWNARFSPSAEDEQAVVDWAQSQGLTITHRYPNRLLVDVEAPAGTIEKALNITLNNYQIGARTFFSNDRDPQLPGNLTDVIWSVQGLNSLEQVRPAGRKLQPAARPDYVAGPAVAAGSNQHASGDSAKLPAGRKGQSRKPNTGVTAITGGNYDPTDIYSYESYNYGWPGSFGLYNQGHCCNPLGDSSGSPKETSIAIAAFADLNYSDVASFQSQYPYLAYNIQKIYIDGTYTCSGFDDGCLEVTMDTEWSMAMSNSFGSWVDTSKVWIYEGVNYTNQTVVDLYNQMLSDGNARVFSTSWDCAEYQSYETNGDCYAATMQARDNILMSMVGQGWTLLAASGDEGATATWCSAFDGVFYPASDPNVIAAGGTTLSLLSGPTYLSEVGWTGGTFPGSCASNDGGSTGGFSSYWGTPSYQSALGFGARAVPDISLNASAFQNVYFAAGGGLIGVGGTSIVAPELAGFFAQENAYLLSLGNICGLGSSPCAPMGNANYYLYDEGIYQTAAHNPFYDITSGCNSNDITATYGLGYYCAGPGYDEVTGWGSANMLQLAWTINWFSAPAIGSPGITFAGPTVHQWYNTDQVVSWTVTDNSGGYPGTGIAGFTQGWDSIPTDPYSEATPGSGNSFYSGPQFPNATSGWLDFSGVSQGCHTVNVEAWNNMGQPSGDATYGPLCYDTIAPVTTATLSGTLSGGVYISTVTVTLKATDSGSGVAATYYQVDGGALLTYSGPFTVSSTGSHVVVFHSKDVAGNLESNETTTFSLEAPTSTSLASSVNPSTYGTSVTFTAAVTPSFGSTATGTITFKDGPSTLGTGALSGGKATFTTTALTGGSHTITAVYGGSANDRTSTSASLSQKVNKAASSTKVASSVNPSSYGQSVTLTATVKCSTTGVPTGKVTFKNGTTGLGSATLNSSGVATLNVSTLTVGSHSITAVYSGSTSLLTSTSPALTETVKKASTTTKLASSLNPSTHGQAVTFTAAITPAFGGSSSGTVTFKDGSTTLGTGTVSGNKATFKTSTLAAGTHSITAVYGGNANYNTSTSAALKQVVNP